MIKILFSYYVSLNFIAFVMMVLDKWYAVKNKWRISEFVLLLSALIGGGIGLISAMVVARHKLSKVKFRILGPLSILLHACLFAYLLFVEHAWLIS